MTNWNVMLGTRGPWTHQVGGGLEAIRATSAEMDASVVNLQGQRMRTLDSLFREYAREFHFPDYFGYNWPAFDECMKDLEETPARAYITVISDAENVLADNPEELETFMRHLESIGQRWATAFGLPSGWGPRGGEIPFHTILFIMPTAPSGL